VLSCKAVVELFKLNQPIDNVVDDVLAVMEKFTLAKHHNQGETK